MLKSLRNIFKTPQIFITYNQEKIKKQQLHHPVIPVSNKMIRSISFEEMTFDIMVPGSWRKEIKVKDRAGNIYKLSREKELTVHGVNGKYNFRIIYDWVDSSDHFFRNFLTWSFVIHLLFLSGFAIYGMAEGVLVERPVNKEPTAERVKQLLSKIEHEKPLRVEKPKPQPEKPVEKIVVKKKEKKRKSVWPTKNPRKKIAKRRPPRRGSTRGVARKTPPSGGGGGGKPNAENIASSLSFLGGSKGQGGAAALSKNASKGGNIYGKAYAKGGVLKNRGGIGSGSKLGAVTSAYNGPINTKGIRGTKSAVYNTGKGYGAPGSGRGKGKVLGRVSERALRGSNRGKVGGALSAGGGLKLSGKGSVSEALVQKAINRRIDRLTYCYEKALLRDSSLAGTIRIQWTLNPSGKVSKLKVIRSELKNKGLHRCLKREISRIPFPRPKGGSATVQYPFKFKATAL